MKKENKFICEMCNKTFYAISKIRKTCSRSCANKRRWLSGVLQKKPVKIKPKKVSKIKKFICEYCNKEFTSYAKERRSCSLSCANKIKWREGVIGLPKKGITKKCLWCSQSFYVSKSGAYINCCSQSCSGKYRYHIKKDIRIKPLPKSECLIKKKYKYIRVNGKRFSEHRAVAEKKIGRKIESNEEVHHINGNHLDNSPDNIEVLSRSEHRRLHAKLRLGLI